MVVHWIGNYGIVCSNLNLCEIRFRFDKIIFGMDVNGKKPLGPARELENHLVMALEWPLISSLSNFCFFN